MATDASPIAVMSTDDCWSRLASLTLGRLATSVDGQPDVFPVNFVVQGRTILIRTAEGTKLVSALVNDRVAFEADDHDVAHGWSVVVKGRAEVLSTARELAVADAAQVLPWTSTPKERYLRIVPTEITGRLFDFGAVTPPVVDAS